MRGKLLDRQNSRELLLQAARSTNNRTRIEIEQDAAKTMTFTYAKHTIVALAGITAFGGGLRAQAAQGIGVTLAGVQTKTLSVAQAAALDKTATPGMVSADKKTLTFRQKTVRIVAHSGPANDMLSYRIDGLKNPTLVVPVGATVKALFINTDDDMTHNLRFGLQHTGPGSSLGTPNLPHKTETAFYAADVTLHVPAKPGTYYYFCTIPGHAPGGMYGTLIVR